MDNNRPCHRENTVIKEMSDNSTTDASRSALILDLSTKEQVWNVLWTNIYDMSVRFQTLGTLEDALVAVCKTISQNQLWQNQEQDSAVLKLVFWLQVATLVVKDISSDLSESINLEIWNKIVTVLKCWISKNISFWTFCPQTRISDSFFFFFLLLIN